MGAYQIHLNWFKHGLHIQNVFTIIERRLFVIKRRKAHAFEMVTVTLLTPHHDPHSSPLGNVDGLDHPGDFIDKSDGTRNVIEDLAIAELLPGPSRYRQRREKDTDKEERKNKA